MLQTTAIGAAATVLKSAVVAAVNPTGEVAIESVLKAGWERASHAIGCFRKNWNRLEPQENLILYRAMLLAHWRALQQTAQQHGRHRGMDLKSVTDVLPLPAALKNALDRNPSTGLGLFSQSDQEALRKLVAVCDDRMAAIEKGGPIGLPHESPLCCDSASRF
jgi:hypothetical protein